MLRKRIAWGLLLLTIGLVALGSNDALVSEAEAQDKKPPSKAKLNQIARHKHHQIQREREHQARQAARDRRHLDLIRRPPPFPPGKKPPPKK